MSSFQALFPDAERPIKEGGCATKSLKPRSQDDEGEGIEFATASEEGTGITIRRKMKA